MDRDTLADRNGGRCERTSLISTGVFVAVSDRGTILLYQAGWTTFHTALKSVVSLQTQHPIGEVSTRTLKICVLT